MLPIPFSSISYTKIFLGIMAIIFSFMLISGFDSILTKFGLETKASVKAELVKANKTIETLQSANENLKQQLVDQEKRHQKELTTVKEVTEKVKQTAKQLEEAKKKLELQNQNLKKKILDKQSEAYNQFNIPEDKFYLYPKSDMDVASSNNYDTIYKFILQEFKVVPVEPITKVEPMSSYIDINNTQLAFVNIPGELH